MRDGEEEEEEEEESGSKAEFIWLTESNPFPVLNPVGQSACPIILFLRFLSISQVRKHESKCFTCF